MFWQNNKKFDFSLLIFDSRKILAASLKSFKLCCLKWSFSWILAPEDLCNFSAGLDCLIRSQRFDLEGWVVSFVSSLPAIVANGSRSFSFPGCSLVQIVFSTTPDSASLVHGFTHDKSVHYLFSTPQARSQQQTEILIPLLKKLAPVNDIRAVLY